MVYLQTAEMQSGTFSKGTVLYKRGWMEEAYNHFAKACDMDPSNPEYSAAYNQIKNQRTGAYGGYNPGGAPRQGGCSGCDVCSGLLCADCCEMFWWRYDSLLLIKA